MFENHFESQSIPEASRDENMEITYVNTELGHYIQPGKTLYGAMV